MNKWNYLVAALLISGASTTFTSCIDNDEPFGIEQMRTAKAEFYSAQAAYKMAEVAYLESQTALQQELLKQEQIETEMQNLKLEILKAQNEAEIEKMKIELEKLRAEHELTLKDIETKMKEAEAAYQTALRDLDLIIAKLNSDYSNEYARLLGNITANRTEYNKLAADLIDAKLTLNQYSEQTLDTASVKGNLELEVTDAQKLLDNLEEQKELLTKLNGADSEERMALAKELNEKIRTLVTEYNDTVQRHQYLSDLLANANQAVTDKRYELLNDYIPKFTETKSKVYNIDENIQNEFITINNLETEDFVTAETLGTYTSEDTKKYYTLENGEFEVKATKDEISTPSGSDNTTIEILLKLNSYALNIDDKWSDIDTPIKEAAVEAQLPAKESWLKEMAETYNKELEDYKKAKETYLDASNDFMIGTKQNWYQKASAAVNAYDISNKEDADKDALIAVLKEYAPLREAYDGYVHMDGETKAYTTLSRDNIESLKDLVLGDDLNATTPTETSALGAFEKICTTLFGQMTLVTPVSVEEEYKYNNTDKSEATTFGKYFMAYKDVQTIKEQKAWKALYENLSADVNTYTLEAAEYSTYAQLVEKDEKLVELKNKALDLQLQVKELEDLVGQDPKVGTVQVTTTSANSTITISETLGGSLGTYITNLVSYHNAVVGENVDFREELEKLEDAIITAQGALATAKNNLAMFNAGGWKLTKSENITIGNKASGYISVELHSTNGSTYTYKITYYNYDGTIRNTELVESTNSSFDTYFDPELIKGTEITVTTEYLKVAIEAYKAKVENIEARMKELDDMLVILQKELADFMEVLNARYPDGTQTE